MELSRLDIIGSVVEPPDRIEGLENFGHVMANAGDAFVGALAAYRRAGVPAKFLVVLSQKASKYFLLRDEGAVPKPKFEERLAALAAPADR